MTNSEFRIPNSESNPKSECRRQRGLALGSDFGLRASFGFRRSDFVIVQRNHFFWLALFVNPMLSFGVHRYQISGVVGWLLFAFTPVIVATPPMFEKDIRPIL